MGDNRNNLSFWPLYILVAAVFAIWAASFLLFFISRDAEFRGTFGDMFGAVNALFSGLASAGVGYAIYAQRQEINRQKKLIESQNEYAQKQSFETTFFKLIELYLNILEHLVIQEGDRRFERKEAIDRFISLLESKFGPTISTEEALSQINRMLREYRRNFGHYIGVVYSLLSFIDRSKIDDKEYKEDHAKIARALISDIEVVLLFYVGLSIYGKKFKPLIEKYGLLRNVIDSYTFNTDLRRMYALGAHYSL